MIASCAISETDTTRDPKRSGTDPAPPCLRPQEPSRREYSRGLNLVRAMSVLSFLLMLGHGFFLSLSQSWLIS